MCIRDRLTELGIPVVVAVNMMDVVKKNGDKINVGELSRQLGCKVVEISALKGMGIMDAAEEAVRAAEGTKTCLLYTSLRAEQKIQADYFHKAGPVQFLCNTESG